MKKDLLHIPYQFLFNCIKEFIGKRSILPDFIMDIVDVLPDGSCQFRALANNITTLKNERRSHFKIAQNMYSKVKEIVTIVLPTLSNQQLISEFGFEEINPLSNPIENINNLIFLHHEPYINNLSEYSRTFTYGTYTTNFELRILLSKPLMKYWIDTFEIPTPCVTIYLKENGYFNEINCLNNGSIIDFRLLYVDSNHYQCMYIKEEYVYFYEIIKKIVVINKCFIIL